eukprot:scaffold4841_cov132-Cylindrotheca_fusiformis.AAC.9
MTTTTIALLSFLTLIASTSSSTLEDEYFGSDSATANLLQGTDTCSLISIVMDESGSMKGEQAFLNEIALPEIILRLQQNQQQQQQVDHIFVCSHGFGSEEHEPFQEAGHFHGCTAVSSSSSSRVSGGNPSASIPGGTTSGRLDNTWANFGQHEDGWQAIQFAIRDTPRAIIDGIDVPETCKSLSKDMILVTDEERYDNSCDGHLFQIELHTDQYGSETSWMLEDRYGNIVLENGVFVSNDIVRVSSCLKDDGGVYKLTFFDSYHDGFCCGHGEGFFKVWYDRELILDSLGDFEDAISFLLPTGILSPVYEVPPYNALPSKFRTRSNVYTHENTLKKLLDTGYRLNVISNFTTLLPLSGVALGVSSDSVVLEATNGSFFGNMEYTSLPPIDLVDQNQQVLDYATIAFETGGAAWSLQSLRNGGEQARSFAEAFVAIKAEEIQEDTFGRPSSSPIAAPPTPPQTNKLTTDLAESNLETSALSSFAIVGVVLAVIVSILVLTVLFSKRCGNTTVLDGNIIKRSRVGIEPDSDLDDANSSPSASDETIFFIPGLTRCLDFATSFRGANDLDHMVDLSDLAGEMA